jgi:hypothetical protein
VVRVEHEARFDLESATCIRTVDIAQVEWSTCHGVLELLQLGDRPVNQCSWSCKEDRGVSHPRMLVSRHPSEK